MKRIKIAYEIATELGRNIVTTTWQVNFIEIFRYAIVAY